MTVTSFDEAQEVFAKSLPGYTRRQHQIDLAAQIERIYAEAVQDEKLHGLLEAGTGTGKSFAIVIPAAIAAKLHGKRTVVATSTKMLQTQYARGDMPFLQEHLGLDFTWALLKGRSNYPCHAKAEELADPTPVQRQIKARMAEAAADRWAIIDREDFPEVANEEFQAFEMSSAECPGADSCPFASTCFAERAKDKAATADIVITNTAMLLLDLKLRQETDGNVALLGDFDVLAIDEAHELPDATTRMLEDTMGVGTFAKLSRDMAAYLNRQEGDVSIAEKIELAAQDLWSQLQMAYSDFAQRAPGKNDPMPLTKSAIIAGHGDALRTLHHAIWDARDEIKATRPFEEDKKGRVQRARLLRRSRDWMQRVSAFATASPEDVVRWAEQETSKFRGQSRTRLFLRSAPINVAPFLQSAMFSKVPTILSSATLTAGSKNGQPNFTYMLETLGLTTEDTLTYAAGSPFNYPEQVRLYVPSEQQVPAPDPKNTASWRMAAQTATRELVLQSGGGALLLFTSTTALREAVNGLGWQFQQAGLRVLVQGDLPNGELVRAFKEDGNAVLFGLKSFMVGVDIPGRALRLVVLDKLPFAVPTDLLYQARCEAIERRYNDKWASFTKLTIPMMILTLTQAFGRLIRHLDDEGVVAVLDSRLHTKRYGKTILDALPPASRTDDINNAMAFLGSVR